MSDLPESSSKISPRLITIFTTVAVLTIVLFGCLVWYTWDTFRYVESTQKNYFRLTELSGSIVHLDEVLTMSARMAAATGEQTWEARYRRYETELDAAIKEAVVLGQGFSLKDAAEKTDTANLNLIDMENQVFDLVRKGQTKKAAAILSSTEYDVQKKIYISGMAQITETIRGNLKKNISEYRHRGYLAIGSILLATPCLMFGWILVARLIRQYNTNRKQAEDALKESESRFRDLAKEMAVIAELGRLISSTFNIDEVYERFATEARKLIPFDRLAVNLHSLHEESIRVAYVFGEVISGRSKGELFPLQGSVSEVLAITRAGLYSYRAEGHEMDQRFDNYAATVQEGLRSLMGVPLIYRDEVIGSLHFRSKTPNAYTEQDLRLAEKIGMQIAGAIGTVKLFSDLKTTENSLRESEEQYRELVENSSDIFFRTDNTGHFTFVNPAGIRIIGYGKEELIGRHYPTLIRPDMREEAMRFFGRQFVKGIQNAYSEYPVITKEGEEIWFGQNTKLIVQDGRVEGFQAMVRDITARKRVEEELRRNRDAAERLAQEISVIAEIGKVVGSTLDIEEVYESFASQTQKLISIDSLTVNLYNFQENTMHVAYVYGLNIDGRRQGDSLVLEGSLSEAVIRARTSRCIQPESVDEIVGQFPRLSPIFQTGLRSIMCVPLVYRDEVIGVLHFRSNKQNAYTEQDLRLAERIGEQIAGAIANAQLYASLKKAEQALTGSERRYRDLSIIDDLTQLNNSRHFYAQLKVELDRSNRYEQPLTLLLLDLDDFKHFNDAYGHVEGDRVLRRLGQVVKHCLRETDFAFRYGGEEFTVLLPMTTSMEGAVTAERIRTKFKKETFSPTLGQEVHKTVSIGLAQYKHQEEMKAFVHRVDQLMYAGKRNGKDRVCSEF